MPSKRSGGELAQALSVCRPAMHRFAYALVGPDQADDLVQDAAERAWRKQRLFDASRGNAQAWLLAIVADQARQRWRRRRPAWEELHRPIRSLAKRSRDRGSPADGGERGARPLRPRRPLRVSVSAYLLPVCWLTGQPNTAPGEAASLPRAPGRSSGWAGSRTPAASPRGGGIH